MFMSFRGKASELVRRQDQGDELERADGVVGRFER